MIFICFLIFGFALAYVFLLIYIKTGWNRLPDFSGDGYKKTVSKITVVVAVRNEEKNIAACISSILGNDFPKSDYEIIVVNDHSTDNTLQMLESLSSDNLRILQLPDHLSGKKAAIAFAVGQSKYDLILCTDADCKVKKTWIRLHSDFASQYQHNFTTSPVLTEGDDSLIERFQFLDFAATMCITGNGIARSAYFLANGANMCFKKEMFMNVGGYSGNEHKASGDDLFLVKKSAVFDKSKIGFLKSAGAEVMTKPETTWNGLFEQRKRWATKSIGLGDRNIIRLQAFVFLYCLLILLSIGIGLAVHLPLFFAGIIVLGIKYIADFIFLSKLAGEFDRKHALKWFVASFAIYFIHILYSGFSALIPTAYTWKGRQNN